MTQEIIKRFAEEHGLSTIRAMVVLTELLGKKKRIALREQSDKKTFIKIILTQIGDRLNGNHN